MDQTALCIQLYILLWYYYFLPCTVYTLVHKRLQSPHLLRTILQCAISTCIYKNRNDYTYHRLFLVNVTVGLYQYSMQLVHWAARKLENLVTCNWRSNPERAVFTHYVNLASPTLSSFTFICFRSFNFRCTNNRQSHFILNIGKYIHLYLNVYVHILGIDSKKGQPVTAVAYDKYTYRFH